MSKYRARCDECAGHGWLPLYGVDHFATISGIAVPLTEPTIYEFNLRQLLFKATDMDPGRTHYVVARNESSAVSLEGKLIDVREGNDFVLLRQITR